MLHLSLGYFFNSPGREINMFFSYIIIVILWDYQILSIMYETPKTILNFDYQSEMQNESYRAKFSIFYLVIFFIMKSFGNLKVRWHHIEQVQLLNPVFMLVIIFQTHQTNVYQVVFFCILHLMTVKLSWLCTSGQVHSWPEQLNMQPTLITFVQQHALTRWQERERQTERETEKERMNVIWFFEE